MNTALGWAKRLHQLPHHTQVPPSGGNELSHAEEVVGVMLDRCFRNVNLQAVPFGDMQTRPSTECWCL